MKHLGFVIVCLAVAARPANAHFKLNQPTAYSQQGQFGDPQKAPPCGDDGSVVPTNQVTTLMEGSQIAINVTEEIFHPGHYRVALAQDMASLPMEPPVTAGTTPCGTTVIDPNPMLPLLGDGLLVHTSAFSGPQTMMVQLPAGMTCDHCTLQVIEFMSNHPLNNPGGCFYHHCATVTISANAPDAGPTSDGPMGSDAGNPDNGPAMGGCCDSGSRSGATSSALTAVVLGVVLRRRKSRAARDAGTTTQPTA